MSTAWLLKTNGDPLTAVRGFLARLWTAAGLEGLFAPVYQETPGLQALIVAPRLLEHPEQLAAVDPFAPLAAANAGQMAARLARERPEARYGAVLRSCEARAWKKLVTDASLDPHLWLIIGVDCLASYPADDFEWRLRRAGGVEALSREALRFARQGGIAPYRYRRGCQMCASPACEEADLHLGLYGLPVKQQIIILAKSAELRVPAEHRVPKEMARRLRMEELTSGPAPDTLVAQHQKMLITVSRRRMGVMQRAIAVLDADLPTGPASLARHIASCTPCRACLDACPINTSECAEAGDTLAWRSWLKSCLSCGLCEEACPEHLPLTAMIARIKQDLRNRRRIDAAAHAN